MKSILLVFLLTLFGLTAQAQHEHDFVTHYTEQYGDTDQLTRLTVSPSMIEAILHIEDCKEDPEIATFLRSVRSVQILTSILDTASTVHYERAVKMMEQNAGRYQLLIEYGQKKIFARQRGNAIVEVVMIMDEKENFLLVDITGEMTEKQIEKIVNSKS